MPRCPRTAHRAVFNLAAGLISSSTRQSLNPELTPRIREVEAQEGMRSRWDPLQVVVDAAAKRRKRADDPK